MGTLWSQTPATNPRDMLRKQDHAIQRALRDLAKERAVLERNEKKMHVDLKKLAKEGRMVLDFFGRP